MYNLVTEKNRGESFLMAPPCVARCPFHLIFLRLGGLFHFASCGVRAVQIENIRFVFAFNYQVGGVYSALGPVGIADILWRSRDRGLCANAVNTADSETVFCYMTVFIGWHNQLYSRFKAVTLSLDQWRHLITAIGYAPIKALKIGVRDRSYPVGKRLPAQRNSIRFRTKWRVVSKSPVVWKKQFKKETPWNFWRTSYNFVLNWVLLFTVAPEEQFLSV